MRNIAIIAHVDHGKTTLVDTLLKQSGTFRENQHVAEFVMDSGDLEKERGITITAKATSVNWQGIRINIVDTPGHADFGGEVERILSMVDGVVLLVDSAEGPLPQTKFVLGKALKLGLRPIVLINKIDRPDSRPKEVLNEVFNLFASLDANDDQLDFPILYASGREGWAVNNLNDERKDISPLFDMILSHVPEPKCYPDQPFSLLVTALEYDSFVGRLLTGKVLSGSLKVNTTIKALSSDNKTIEQVRVSKIMAWQGLKRVGLDEAKSGDIVTVAGFEKATVADTLCDLAINNAIESTPIDPPTLAMTFSVNNSPLAGQEGSKVTSRMIYDRLMKESEGNVALRIQATPNSDSFEVAGRGELQLGVLIETMRREGFELSISRPRVLFKTDENGNKMEPYEEVTIDVDDQYSGTVIDKMNQRKAELLDMKIASGKTRLIFLAPSRGLIGYHSAFLTDTSGTGVMNKLFHSYGPYKGAIGGRKNGVLISTEKGASVAYAMWKLEERGKMFIDPGVQLYSGMIIGENSRGEDLEVNPCKAKQLTNIRTTSKDEAVVLTPPVRMTLEDALSYIQDDELIEVTPKTIRLRKAFLDSNDRRRLAKKSNQD